MPFTQQDLQKFMSGQGAASPPTAPRAIPNNSPEVRAVGKQYPVLGRYLNDVVIQPGTNAKGDDRQVEMYPPWESSNPNKGKITIQPFRSDLTSGANLTNTVAGELLHHIGGIDPATGKPVDPQYQQLKQSVISARTSSQQALDQKIYAQQKTKGESRSFRDWLNQSRADEYIMGYVTPDATDEWRKNGFYDSPAMKTAVEGVRGYLTSPSKQFTQSDLQGFMGRQPSPTSLQTLQQKFSSNNTQPTLWQKLKTEVGKEREAGQGKIIGGYDPLHDWLVGKPTKPKPGVIQPVDDGVLGNLWNKVRFLPAGSGMRLDELAQKITNGYGGTDLQMQEGQIQQEAQKKQELAEYGPPSLTRQVATGLLSGAGEAVVGATSPQNLALLATGAGEEKLGASLVEHGIGNGEEIAKTVGKLAHLGFTAQMATGTVDATSAAWQAHKQGDTESTVRLAVAGLVSAAMAGAGAHDFLAQQRVTEVLNDQSARLYQKKFTQLDPQQKAAAVYEATTKSPSLQDNLAKADAFIERAKREGLPEPIPPPALQGTPSITIGQPPADFGAARQALTGTTHNLRVDRELSEIPQPVKSPHEEAPITLNVPVYSARERQEIRYRAMDEEAARIVERVRQDQLDTESRAKDAEVERAAKTPYTVTDRRSEAAQQIFAELGEKAKNSEAMKLYNDHIDALAKTTGGLGFRSTEEAAELIRAKRARGTELNPEENSVLAMDAKRQEILSSLAKNYPRAKDILDTLNHELNSEDIGNAIKYAGQESDLTQAANSLERQAVLSGDPFAADLLAQQAHEARQMAERVISQRNAALAAVEARNAEKKVIQRGTNLPYTLGNATDLHLADGRGLSARYAAVPLSSLILSHDPFSFEWNPKYEPRRMQPRDLATNKNAQAAILTDSKPENYQPERYTSDDPTAINGPAAILPDGRVVGGNSRLARLVRRLRGGDGADVAAQMYSQFPKFGIDMPDLFDPNDPYIPVRVLTDVPETTQDLIQLGQDLNRDPIMGFSPSEQAVMNADRLTPEDVDRISGMLDSIPGEPSLRDALRARGQQIMDLMVQRGIIPENKREEYIVNGELTEKGKDAFESTIRGAAIDDPDLLATTPAGVLQRIDRVLPSLVRLKAAGGDWDVRDYLKDAMRQWKQIESIRSGLNAIGAPSDSIVDKFYDPQDFSRGTGMMNFGGEEFRPKPHPITYALVRALDDKPLSFKDAVARFAEEAEGRNMRLTAPPEPYEVFNDTIGKLAGVEVHPADWGTVVPATEAQKEEVDQVLDPPKPLVSTKESNEMTMPPNVDIAANNLISAVQDGTVTPEDLRALFAAHPALADKADFMMEVLGKIIPNSMGVDLRETLAKKIADVVREPGEQGNNGAVEFLDDGRAIIRLFDTANPSTVLHEFVHVIRRGLVDERDIAALEKFAGVEHGLWDKAAEERVARGFEKYMQEGVAPDEELKPLFERMKDVLRQIYGYIRNGKYFLPKSSPINVKLTEGARATFDRWFGVDKEMAPTPETEAVPSSASLEMAVTPSERNEAVIRFNGAHKLAERMGDARSKRFPDLAEAQAWAVMNKDNLWGVEGYELPNGAAFVNFVPQDNKTLLQRESMTFGEMIRRSEQLKKQLEAERNPEFRGKIEDEIRRLDAKIGVPGLSLASVPRLGEMAPPPEARPEPKDVKYLFGVDDAERQGRLSDEAARLQKPAQSGSVDEQSKRPVRAGSAGGVGRGDAGRSGAGAGDERPSRSSLPAVKAAALAAPTRMRPPAIVPAEKWTRRMKDLRMPENLPPPTVKLDDDLAAVLIFPGQQEVVESTLSALDQFDGSVIATPTGTGKCMQIDTPILMHNGTTKKVQDVVVGDLLMGPDSKRRRVLSLARGTGQMYRIVPTKGMAYGVNEPHILSLKLTPAGPEKWNQGKIVNISVKEYIAQSKYFKHRAKGYRVGVEFKPQPVTVDPYFLGVWLGDGTYNAPIICKNDAELVEFLGEYATALGLSLKKYKGNRREPTYALTGDGGGKGSNPLRAMMNDLDIFGNKHVPQAYKSNSRAVRLQVLAGLIDTDGYLSCSGYDIVSKYEVLANDIAFLARSLGLAAYVKQCQKCCTNTGAWGTYYRVFISGDIDMIPVKIARRKAHPRKQKKDVLVTGIKVEPIGMGDYYGFEIDGDHLFLLGDFTVTHNSYAQLAVVKQLMRNGQADKTLIITKNDSIINSPRKGYKDIGKSTFGLAIKDLPKRGALQRADDGVYIATYATLRNRPDINHVPWNLVVLDESAEASNWQSSAQGKAVRLLNNASEKVVYASATPFSSAVELGYMGKLGLWNKGDFGTWAKQFGVFTDSAGNFSGGGEPKKLLKLREQLIERGQFVTQEKSMKGFTAHFAQVPLNPEQRTQLREIISAMKDAAAFYDMRGKSQMANAVRGNMATFVKSWLERQRLPETIEVAKKMVAQGWKPVIFSETRSKVDNIYDFLADADRAMGGRLSTVMPRLPGVYETLAEEFGADKVANFSGAYSAAREQEKEAFDTGAKPIMFATYGAGGIGVSLHDTVGNSPRAAIFLGPPWSGKMFDQAMGREWRYGTKSNVYSVFMVSNAMPETKMILTKVAPRLEALRASVEGITNDPLVQRMRDVGSTREELSEYEMGGKDNSTVEDMTDLDTHLLLANYKEISVPSAKDAQHKGMTYPGQVDDRPGVITLFQEDGSINLPDRFRTPQEEAGSRLNEEIAQSFVDGGAVPGVGENLSSVDPGARRMMADAIGPTIEETVRNSGGDDPSSVVRQAWQNQLTRIQAIKEAGGVGFNLDPSKPAWEITAPPGDFEGSPSGTPTGQDPGGLFSTWTVQGRHLVKRVAGRVGVPEIGSRLQRMIRDYQVRSFNYGGDFQSEFHKILKDNKITQKEDRILMAVKEGKVPPPNERIAKAVQELVKLTNRARAEMGNRGITGQFFHGKDVGQYSYMNMEDDPNYAPHIFNYNEKITLTDPKTGEQTVFTLNDLLQNKKLAQIKREQIIAAMQNTTGMSKPEIEDWLNRKSRRVPLAGTVERARQADLPFYRADRGAWNQYFAHVGEVMARAEVIGQTREKLDGVMIQVPNEKARKIINSVFDGILAKKPWDEQMGKYYARWGTAEVLSKMAFSSVKVPFHLAHTAVVMGDLNSVVKAAFRGVGSYSNLKDRAMLSGVLVDQMRAGMMMEQAAGQKATNTMLEYTGFHAAYTFDRVVANAAAQTWMEQVALPKLMKGGRSVENIRTQLKEKFLMDDKDIDAAISRGRWTQEDLNRGGAALTSRTLFTTDPSELPPEWRDDSNSISSLFRVATILKGFVFKTGALIKEDIIDEARRGNYRPLMYAGLVYPVVGEMIQGLSAGVRSIPAYATGNPDNPLQKYERGLESLIQDPSAMKILQRYLDDVGHATGMTMLMEIFDTLWGPSQSKRASQYKLKNLAGDELSWMAGAYADLYKTTSALFEILSANAETGEQKMGVADNWLREEAPIFRSILPPPGKLHSTQGPAQR